MDAEQIALLSWGFINLYKLSNGGLSSRGERKLSSRTEARDMPH
jgi:hypothetical protein